MREHEGGFFCVVWEGEGECVIGVKLKYFVFIRIFSAINGGVIFWGDLRIKDEMF